MLTWDEEVTSALAKTAYAGLQQHRVVDTPPPPSATAAQTDRTAASIVAPARTAPESRASGTHRIQAADKRIGRVLWNDPATGVMRHADAGYEIARPCAREQGLNLPMLRD